MNKLRRSLLARCLAWSLVVGVIVGLITFFGRVRPNESVVIAVPALLVTMMALREFMEIYNSVRIPPQGYKTVPDYVPTDALMRRWVKLVVLKLLLPLFLLLLSAQIWSVDGPFVFGGLLMLFVYVKGMYYFIDEFRRSRYAQRTVILNN